MTLAQRLPSDLHGRRAVILAGGEPEPADLVARFVDVGDLVIAANGGARLARAAGITPHLLVGDLDSLEPDERAALPSATRCWQHPPDKDESDLELALQAALEARAREVIVLGAFGGRLDHLLVNVGLLHAAHERGTPTRLLSVRGEAFLLADGSCRLDWPLERSLTVTALTPEVVGLTLEGVAFPVTGMHLSWGSSRGLSNRITAVPARVSVGRGRLLVVGGPRSETIEVRRTYLELNDRSAFRPRVVDAPGLRLEPLERCTPGFYRYLYNEAGEAWHWVDRRVWDEHRIVRHLADPAVSVWVLHENGVPAGWFELERAVDATQIAYLGLLPGFLGRGLGGHLLSLAVAHALAPSAGCEVASPSRVWLHTCDLDAPAALPNYRARGFVPFREEVYAITRPCLRA